MGQAEGLETRNRCAVPLNEPGSDRARAGDADLLADDGPHPCLEWIPRARRAKSGTGMDERTDDRVAHEVPRCGLSVGVEVEDVSSALSHMNQALPVGQVSSQQKVIRAAR